MMRSSRERRVCLMTPVLTPHDAIGNDVLGMAACLRKNGFIVETYAETVHPLLKTEARIIKEGGGHRFWTDPRALIVYHHSMAWPAGFNILTQCRGFIAVKYHNVTPPEFFRPYSQDHANACETGEFATLELANGRRDTLFWADSRFNADDLVQRGARAEACRVLPPFHVVESMGSMAPDIATINRFRHYSGTKLLCVGGLKPNKGHRCLIRALAYLRRRYDPDAVLFIAGVSDPRLAGYKDALSAYAHELHIEDAVIFTGPVSDAALRSLYLLADVFLCLSQHEGFCVPLIEAMYFRAPIVAGRQAAVEETVGDSGLMCSDEDLEAIAYSIDRATTVPAVSSELRRAGWHRFHERFSTRVIENRFLSLIDEAFAA